MRETMGTTEGSNKSCAEQAAGSRAVDCGGPIYPTPAEIRLKQQITESLQEKRAKDMDARMANRVPDRERGKVEQHLLTLTSTQIRRLAQAVPDLDAVLRRQAREAFVGPVVSLSPDAFTSAVYTALNQTPGFATMGGALVRVCETGPYKGLGLLLDNVHQWELINTADGPVLVCREQF